MAEKGKGPNNNILKLKLGKNLEKQKKEDIQDISPFDKSSSNSVSKEEKAYQFAYSDDKNHKQDFPSNEDKRHKFSSTYKEKNSKFASSDDGDKFKFFDQTKEIEKEKNSGNKEFSKDLSFFSNFKNMQESKEGSNFKGLPQIIQNTSTTTNHAKPFQKKTFIPPRSTKFTENRFEPKPYKPPYSRDGSNKEYSYSNSNFVKDASKSPYNRDRGRPPRDPNSVKDPNKLPRDPNRPFNPNFLRETNKPYRNPNFLRDTNRPFNPNFVRDPNRPPRDPNAPRSTFRTGTRTGEPRSPFNRDSSGTRTPFRTGTGGPSRSFRPSLITKSRFETPNPFRSANSFDKKSTVDITGKRKKSNRRESTKPKLSTFSSFVGNNFIGRIEYSALEDSEYYKIRKERRNHQNKNKVFVAKTIELEVEISLKELASKLSLKLDEIERQAHFIGLERINETDLVNIEILEMIATSLGHKVIRKDSINQEKLDVFTIKLEEESSAKRTPIVAIVGHVDHGKTSLLDRIRKSNLAKTEFGGITQKITAYTIASKNRTITFIDTPGHAAFTKMRQRGINLNDITILVVSSVEGVKEQTIEAINQINKSNTQLIIAATKIDLPGSNLDKIKQDLSKYNILVKDYGGEIELIGVSAVTGENIDFLLDTILVYADLMNLKANMNCGAIGVVLESKVDAKTGVLSTVIIEQGTLKVGDICSTKQTFGKIKRITDDTKKNIKEATAGMAVEILGFEECALPGEKFAVVTHDLAMELTKKSAVIEVVENAFSAESIFLSEKPILNIILNADTQGALEALEQSLKKLNTVHSTYKIIKKSVGKIKDSDLELGRLSNAIILAYNLSIDKDIQLRAHQEKIVIVESRIIYELEKLVEQELDKLIVLIEEEVLLGQAVVKRLFKSSKIGNISGCLVTNGKIMRNAVAKVVRKGAIVFTGKIDSLQRKKDDVKEVSNGLECGIFVNYKEIMEGDEIFCYKIEFKKPI